MKFNKENGQASRLFLVMGIVILVAVIIVYLVMKMAEKPPAPKPIQGTPVVMPFYEKQLGDVRFVFESALDRGNVLRASEIANSQYNSSYQKDYFISNPGAKFIQVTIGAQNEGTENIEQNAWTIENIIDSENRNFVPLEGYTVSPWIPSPDTCGALLKPAFDPTPCTKIYEVSKESTGLKIRVITGKENTYSNLSAGKTDSFLIDLIVK